MIATLALSAETKNAPAAGGHQREGEDPSTYERNQIMPIIADPAEDKKAKRKAKRQLRRRIQSAPARSIAASGVKIKPYRKPQANFQVVDRTASVELGEAQWADLNLAGLEILLRPSKYRVSVWEDAEGRWWRRVGTIAVHPGHDGVMRFYVRVLKGANAADVEWANRVIVDAIEGKFLRHGWKQTSDGEGWIFFGSRAYADPFTSKDPSPEVRPCTDQRCMLRLHPVGDEDHVAEEIYTDGFSIKVRRFEPDTDYKVNVYGEENLAPSQVASFISDLQWARAACELVNQTPIDSTVKCMRDQAGYWERRNAAEQQQEVTA